MRWRARRCAAPSAIAACLLIGGLAWPPGAWCGAWFDRIAVDGGTGRHDCPGIDALTPEQRNTIRSLGFELERHLSPAVTIGGRLGTVQVTGSGSVLLLPEGTTGSLYYRVDQEHVGYGYGFTADPELGLPFPLATARLGRADGVHVSASLFDSNPSFSGEDLEVGVGAQPADALGLWFGASAPLGREVTALKAAATFGVGALEVRLRGHAGATTSVVAATACTSASAT
jgi:hypothetical protein